jgi:hypothetical protein
MKEILLMSHVLFGLACVAAAIWLFVDVLHASPANLARIRAVSRGIAAAMWIAFVLAGYWYVTNYKIDKAVILKGPWPFAHSFFMETKEHLAILLLLLTSYLPIVASQDLAKNPEARKLVLWVTALIAFLALAMEGEGGIIAMGVKVGLQAKGI